MTLHDIVVTDPKVGHIVLGKTTLAPGESTTATSSDQYTITQADMDAGFIKNQATATGKDPKDNPVTDTSDSSNPNDKPGPDDPTEDPLPQDNTLALIKAGVYQDSDGKAGVTAGDKIHYTLTAENKGNVTLTNVTISDKKLGLTDEKPTHIIDVDGNKTELTADQKANGVTLKPGEKAVLEKDYTLLQTDIDNGQVDNSATAKGTDPKGTQVTDVSDSTNPADDDGKNPAKDPELIPLGKDGETDNDPTVTPLEQTPKISLLKEVDKVEKADGTKETVYTDVNNDGVMNAGDKLSYDFTVENTGNVKLENVRISDPLLNITDAKPTHIIKVVNGVEVKEAITTDTVTLQPGEKAVLEDIEYTITQDNVDKGKVINQATATGTPPTGPDVTDKSDDPQDPKDVDPNNDGNPDDPTETLIPALTKLIIDDPKEVREGDPNDGDILFTNNVYLENTLDKPVKVAIGFGADDTAKPNDDYAETYYSVDGGTTWQHLYVNNSAGEGNIILPAGTTSKNPVKLRYKLTNDTVIESQETFTVTATAVDNLEHFAKTDRVDTVTNTINDNDFSIDILSIAAQNQPGEETNNSLGENTYGLVTDIDNGIVVTGKTNNVVAGAQVTVLIETNTAEVSGSKYTRFATVANDGTWSVSLTENEAKALSFSVDKPLKVTATVSQYGKEEHDIDKTTLVQTDISINRITDPTINEADTDAKHTFEIVQNEYGGTTDQASPLDTTVTAKIDTSVSDSIDPADIKKIVYTDESGQSRDLTDTEINNLLGATGFNVTIPAGSTGKPTFDVVVENDTKHEKDEVVKMTIESSTNKLSPIAKPTDQGNILDDDNPAVTITSDEVIEGNNLTHTVTLNKASADDMTVTIKMTNGSATLGTDTTDPIQVSFDGTNWTTVTPTNGSFEVVMPAGKTIFDIKVPSKEDWDKEGSETYNITASVQGQEKAAEATGTIKEFDAIRVSEEGLLEPTDANDMININDANGIQDDTGTNTPKPYDGNKADTTNEASATGTLGFDTAVEKFDYAGPTITSNGKTVNWAWDSAEKELVGSVTENGKTAKVMTIELDDADTDPSNGVDYKATLHQGIDHNNGDNIENVLDIKLRATDTNGDTGTFVVGVEDDMPVITNKVVNSPSFGHLELNLIVTLDVSASMLSDRAGDYPYLENGKGVPRPHPKNSNDPNVTNPAYDGTSRLSMAKDAITGMLETYRNYGDVKVKVVKFATKAGMVTQADEWVSVEDAITAINAITIDPYEDSLRGPIGHSTNYDAALAQTIEAFDKNDAGYIQDADNQIFILTDGEPQVGDGESNDSLENKIDLSGKWWVSGKGINAAEETLWTDFLKTNKIKSHSIGFGGVSGSDPLDPMAYDGRPSDKNPQGKDLDGIVFGPNDDLAAGLQELVEVPPVKKDLVNNKYNGGIDNAFGGDGAAVTEVTVEGKTYAYNNNTNQMTNPDGSVTTGPKATIITGQGSELVLDLSTGKFNYFGAKKVAISGGKETIELNYKVQDQDGDFNTATTRLNFASSQDVNTDPYVEIMAGKIPNDATEGANNDLTYVVKYQEPEVTKGGGIGTNSNIHVSVTQKAGVDNLSPEDIQSITYTDANTGQQKVLTTQAEIENFFNNGVEVKIVVDTNAAPMIIVRPKDDKVLENDEVLELTITKPALAPTESVRYQLGFDKAFGTVHDNDLMPVLPTQNESVVEATGDSFTKTLTIINPQNLKTLTIGGRTVPDDVSLANPMTITTDKGTLSITAYDKASGIVQYKYTENGDAEDHSNGDVIDNFAIGGTDNTGNAITEGRLAITITDTVPTAHSDTDSVTENETAPATGNVITGADTTNTADGKDDLNVDTPITVTAVKPENGTEADKKVVAENAPQTVTGKYGTLTINADGSYEYTLDNANPAVQALDDNEKLADKFEYTISDSDGDDSTKTLTMFIDGVTDTVSQTEVSIERTSAESIDEGSQDKLIFEIRQTGQGNTIPTASDTDTTVTVKIPNPTNDPSKVEANDIFGEVKYIDATGTETILSADDVNALVSGNGYQVTIPAGSKGKPRFEIISKPDTHVEQNEIVEVVISDSTNPTSPIVTPSATGTIIDAVYTDVSIQRTSAEHIHEGTQEKLVFEIEQTGRGNTTPTASKQDTTLTVKIPNPTNDPSKVEANDIFGEIKYIDANGNAKILSPTEANDLVTGNGYQITIPANSTGKPRFEIISKADTNIEQDELVKMVISDSTNPNAQIVTDNAQGTIDDTLYIDINSISGTNQPENEFNNSLGENKYGELKHGTDSLVISGVTNAVQGSTVSIDILHNVAEVSGSKYTNKQVTVGADGSWSLTLTANQVKALTYKEGEPLIIKARVTEDGITANDIDHATLTKDIQEVVAVVSEEGLANGLTDTVGTADTTDSVTSTGKVGTTNPITGITDVIAQELVAANKPLTSGGKAVSDWQWDPGTKTLQGRDTDGNNVIKVAFNDNNTSDGVDYTVTLQKAIDHPINNGEDNLTLVLKATDSAGQKHDVKVIVEDDSPVNDYNRTETTAPTKNVILTLDASEAMNEMTTVNGQQVTKWKASIDATLKMLEKQNAEATDIKVMINKFSDGSSDTLTEWMSYDDAVAYLQSATVNGGDSDWVGGLTQLLDDTKTEPTADQTYHYFITADNPTGFTNASAFTRFRNQGKINDIGDKYNIGDDNWFAVGIDQGASYTYLRRLASKPADVLRPDADDLETDLVDSVKALPLTRHTGFLLESESNLEQQIGADGDGYISKVVLEGKTYTYDIATNKITLPDGTQVDSTVPGKTVVDIVTSKNSFVQVDMKTGEIHYNPSATAVRDGKEDVQIDFQLTDADGDVSNMLHYTFTQSKPTNKSAFSSYSSDVSGDRVEALIDHPEDIDDRSSTHEDAELDKMMDSTDHLLPVIDHGEIHMVDLDDAIMIENHTLTTHNQSGKLVLDFSWTALQDTAKDGLHMIDLTQEGSQAATSQVLILDKAAVDMLDQSDILSDAKDLLIKADDQDMIQIKGAEAIQQNVMFDDVAYIGYDLNHDLMPDVYIHGGEVII